MSDFKFEAWPSEYRQINQYFGANPQNYNQFGLPGHEGLDIMAPTGSKIFAVAPGKVVQVRTQPTGHNYGIFVRVEHQDGYETTYAHMQEAKVTSGQTVQAGDLLGLADNTGNSFGSHLHLTLKKKGVTQDNWPYNIIDPTPFILPLMGWETPSGPFTDGWGYTAGLNPVNNLAQVSSGGINLRQQPATTATSIALVPGGTIVILNGAAQGDYTPIRVPNSAIGVATPPTPPPATPPTTTQGTVDGWGFNTYLTPFGDQAVVGQYGINLRAAGNKDAANIGLVIGGRSVTLLGEPQGDYRPVRVRLEDFQGPVNTAVAPKLGTTPAPTPAPPVTPPSTGQPTQTTKPGWAFTTQMISGPNGTATAGQYGINMRAAARRDAANIGFIPAGTPMIITGAPSGEYTPVRVEISLVQVPFDTTNQTRTALPANVTTVPQNPDPVMIGAGHLGLHASADPDITEAEFTEFAAMNPNMIKVLSFHSGEAIARLAKQHPNACFVVRTFLDFGGRNITPDQFIHDTLTDTKRALAQLKGRDVVIELHNEPNLVPEGMQSSWKNGVEFRAWWLDLLAKYRQALPGYRFIFPGLSPGSSVGGLKEDHIQFIEACRDAVTAADGLGVHIYWSNVYPMATALGVLDDYITRFRGVPIWITEASNNKGGVTPEQKGREYLEFWRQIQRRPTVQGVTFFVASASNPEFKEEVWVGRGIGQVVGSR